MTLLADPPRVLEVHGLDFDTRLFGAKLGSVSRASDTAPSAADLRAALTQARGDGFAHVIFRVGAEDNLSTWAAEQAGMRLVDIGVDSTFDLVHSALPELPTLPLVREARPEDLQLLQDLAAVAFV